jgi:hypothetical protein
MVILADAAIKNSLPESETYAETIDNTLMVKMVADPITGRFLIAGAGSLEPPAP